MKKHYLQQTLLITLAALLSACGGTLPPPPTQNLAIPTQTRPTPDFESEETTAPTTESFTAHPTAPHIALLLPLHGPLKSQAEAIENGFFAASYANGAQHDMTPAIRVYDTTEGSIDALYESAIKQGAEYIVGPLTKVDLKNLANEGRLSVPTLALNTLDDGTQEDNLFQFGLSPLDEAQQVARKMHDRGYSRILMITPASDFGNRVSSAFTQQWNALGGRVMGTLRYTPQTNLTQQIPALLHVKFSSLQHLQHHKHSVETDIENTVRRQDVDAIFLVGSSAQGRQIMPLINYYYANDLPVYAISSIYGGVLSPTTDHDLDRVIFDDMPWTIPGAALSSTDQLLKTNAAKTWGATFSSNIRLYALGIDAYNLIWHLSALRASASQSLAGATGMLYVLPNGHIYRGLSWARFIDGVPRAI